MAKRNNESGTIIGAIVATVAVVAAGVATFFYWKPAKAAIGELLTPEKWPVTDPYEPGAVRQIRVTWRPAMGDFTALDYDQPGAFTTVVAKPWFAVLAVETLPVRVLIIAGPGVDGFADVRVAGAGSSIIQQTEKDILLELTQYSRVSKNHTGVYDRTWAAKLTAIHTEGDSLLPGGSESTHKEIRIYLGEPA